MFITLASNVILMAAVDVFLPGLFRWARPSRF